MYALLSETGPLLIGERAAYYELNCAKRCVAPAAALTTQISEELQRAEAVAHLCKGSGQRVVEEGEKPCRECGASRPEAGEPHDQEVDVSSRSSIYSGSSLRTSPRKGIQPAPPFMGSTVGYKSAVSATDGVAGWS